MRPTCHCGKPCMNHGIRAGKRVWKTVCSGCTRRGVDRAKANTKKTKSRRRKQLYIRGKKMCPCTDCGIQYDWWKMQFDHVDPSTKRHNLSQAHKCSWATIHNEIAKCDVVCALCHADRTYKGKHWLTDRDAAQTGDDPQHDMFMEADIAS